MDYTLPATYGNATLRAGFQPDPYRVSIVSGGRHRANEVRSGCAGWVASAPDFQLTFSAGSLPLIISAASSTDTTLLVNDPNGNWHCNDDGGNQGLNPALTFYNAMSGTYDIWIGSYSQGNNANATLSISELYSE
ncbi:MAG: peptidase S1 [Alphaproteobacteria bacterium]|nr:peptidase S1 [Alphaproteobacteria bacterium]